LKFIIAGIFYSSAIAPALFAEVFNIPGGELDAALDAYSAQSGIVVAISNDAIRGVHTNGVRAIFPRWQRCRVFCREQDSSQSAMLPGSWASFATDRRGADDTLPMHMAARQPHGIRCDAGNGDGDLVENRRRCSEYSDLDYRHVRRNN